MKQKYYIYMEYSLFLFYDKIETFKQFNDI